MSKYLLITFLGFAHAYQPFPRAEVKFSKNSMFYWYLYGFVVNEFMIKS